MAMDVQHSLEEDTADLNTTINTTPLVDVMLVLLVIFLVTVPVVVQTHDLDLPNYRNIVTETKPENIVIEVDRAENIYLNTAPTDLACLRGYLIKRQTAVKDGKYPEVHIRADKATRYEVLAEVLSEASKDGVTRIGFVTHPRAP